MAFNSIQELSIGLKVRCIYASSLRYGEIGTIIAFYPFNNFEIEWDDGYSNDTIWINPRNFESADDPSLVKEQPCQLCGRMNNLNVKVCYWCGSQI